MDCTLWDKMSKGVRRKKDRPLPLPSGWSLVSARVWEGITTYAVGFLILVTPFLFNPWLVQPSSADRFYLIKDAFVLSVMALCVALWTVRAAWRCRLPAGRHGWIEVGGATRELPLRVWEGCLIAFVILGFFSTLTSSVLPLSYGTLLALSLAVLFYFFFSRSFRPPQMRRLLLLQVHVAGLVGLHCLAQYYGYEPGRLIGGENVTSQAIGYLGQVMITGAYLAIIAPVGMAFLLTSSSLTSRLSLALSVVFSLLGLMATGNRAGNLGAVVGLVVFGLLALYAYRLQVRAYWRMAFISCFLLSFLAVGISSQLPIFARLQTTLARVWAGEWEAAIGTRLYAWQFVPYMVADHPFLGHGMGSWWKTLAEYQARYNPERDPTGELYSQAHNEFLQIWVEMGTPALLVVLAGLATLAAYGIRRAIDTSSAKARNPSDPTNSINSGLEGLSQLHLCGLTGSLATITFVAFFSFIFHSSSVVVPILLFVSALATNPTNSTNPSNPANPRGPRNLFSLLLIFSVVAALLWSLREVTRPFRASLLENQGDILLGEEMTKEAGGARREAFEAAVWWYRRALEVYPESPHANHALGVALTYLGRIQEAVAAFGRAIQLTPAAETYLWLGQAYVAAGEIDKAHQAFETGRKIKGLKIFEEWLQALERAR